MATDKMCGIRLGVDFGTSNCSVTAVHENDIILSHNSNEHPGLKPHVLFTEFGRIFGQVDAGWVQQYHESEVFALKRLVGLKSDNVLRQREELLLPFPIDNNNNNTNNQSQLSYIKVDCFQRTLEFSPQQIIGMIFGNIKEHVENLLTCKSINDIVVTVPGNFDSYQRQAIIDAVKFAGFQNIRLLNEATALVVSYVTNNRFDRDNCAKHILTVDIGGGYSSASYSFVEEEAVEIKYMNFKEIGGIDCDSWMLRHCFKIFQTDYPSIDINDSTIINLLKRFINQTKEQLFLGRNVKNIPLNGGMHFLRATFDFEGIKHKFLDIIRAFFCETFTELSRFVKIEDIQILLHGTIGKSQIIRDLLIEVVPSFRDKIITNRNNCISSGAAAYANHVFSDNNLKITERVFRSFDLISNSEKIDLVPSYLPVDTVRTIRLTDNYLIRELRTACMKPDSIGMLNCDTEEVNVSIDKDGMLHVGAISNNHMNIVWYYTNQYDYGNFLTEKSINTEEREVLKRTFKEIKYEFGNLIRFSHKNMLNKVILNKADALKCRLNEGFQVISVFKIKQVLMEFEEVKQLIQKYDLDCKHKPTLNFLDSESMVEKSFSGSGITDYNDKSNISMIEFDYILNQERKKQKNPIDDILDKYPNQEDQNCDVQMKEYGPSKYFAEERFTDNIPEKNNKTLPIYASAKSYNGDQAKGMRIRKKVETVFSINLDNYFSGRSNRSVTIGIDFGSSNCTVGVADQGTIKIIENCNGQKISSSSIAFTDTGRVFGVEAEFLTSKRKFCVIRNSKRFLGTLYTQKQDDNILHGERFLNLEENERLLYAFRYQGREIILTAEQVAAMILKHLKGTVEKNMECTVDAAVIAVPCYFTSEQRRSLLDAAEIANLKVSKLLNETTATALTLQHRKRDILRTTVTVICDIGGSGTSISLLKLTKHSTDIIAVDGSSKISGDLFDYKLLLFICNQIRQQCGIDISIDADVYEKVRYKCKDCKEKLSILPVYLISLDDLVKNKHFSCWIKQEEFQNLIKVDLEKELFQLFDRIVYKSNLSSDAVQEIILVGGSSRIPLVQSIVQQYFSKSILKGTLNSNEAVAYGAALCASGRNSVCSVKDIVTMPSMPFENMDAKFWNVPESKSLVSYKDKGILFSENPKIYLDVHGIISYSSKKHDLNKYHRQRIKQFMADVEWFDVNDANNNILDDQINLFEKVCFQIKNIFKRLKGNLRHDVNEEIQLAILDFCDSQIVWVNQESNLNSEMIQNKIVDVKKQIYEFLDQNMKI